MNPDVVRWMLWWTTGYPLTTEDEEVIYKLYYKFFFNGCAKSQILIAFRGGSGTPEGGQEANSFVLEESAKFNIPTGEGKMGETLFQYLLIGNLRMVFDGKWMGWLKTLGTLNFDYDYSCHINLNEYYEAGAYVGLTAFKEMQKFSEELEAAKD